jgi:hypothetical protein
VVVDRAAGVAVAVIIATIIIISAEAAGPLKCHRDVRLGFSAWNDDGKALLITDLLGVAPCHLHRLNLNIGIEPRRLITFIATKGNACGVEEARGASGCRRAALQLAGRSCKDRSSWRCIVRGGP